MPPSMPADLGTRPIREALAEFSIAPTDDQILKIRAYTALLLKWNRSISLTSVTDPTEIVQRHFGESMFAASLLPFDGRLLVDVGTGAGFPGLALKIAVPSLRLLLIDSNKKKCAFLAEVVRSLELFDVEVSSERFEDIRPETLHADLITSRAVGEFRELLRWSAKSLGRRGHLLLWVGADDSTRVVSDKSWTWQPGVKIPGSQRRLLVIGRPIVAG